MDHLGGAQAFDIPVPACTPHGERRGIGHPPLVGDRVILDQPRPGDWRVLDMLSEGGSASGARVAPPARHVFKAWARQVSGLAPECEGAWIVRSRESGEALGLILYAAGAPRSAAAITIGIAARLRRRGYAREAIALAMRHLFEGVGFSDVAAEIAPRNTPSLRLFLGLGFAADLGEKMKRSSAFPGEALTLRLTSARFAAWAVRLTP